MKLKPSEITTSDQLRSRARFVRPFQPHKNSLTTSICTNGTWLRAMNRQPNIGLVWQRVLINLGKIAPHGNFPGRRKSPSIHRDDTPRMGDYPAALWKLFKFPVRWHLHALYSLVYCNWEAIGIMVLLIHVSNILFGDKRIQNTKCQMLY